MLKWLENIRKSISGARSSKKNGTRKRGKDDVQLESVEETKTLNVITKARPKGKFFCFFFLLFKDFLNFKKISLENFE